MKKYCRDCFKKSRQGENNINYQAYKEKNNNRQEGKSFEPYSSEVHSTLKEKIRTRDNYNCRLCQIL
jgi:5-methylcytosine-specific restriction endonuclease McrA